MAAGEDRILRKNLYELVEARVSMDGDLRSRVEDLVLQKMWLDGLPTKPAERGAYLEIADRGRNKLRVL